MREHSHLQPSEQQLALLDNRTQNIIRFVAPYTCTSVERISALINAVDHVQAAGIRGDFVECGVWRGGSSMAMLEAMKQPLRSMWLYDTFDGMTAPDPVDVDWNGTSAADDGNHMRCSLHAVQENFARCSQIVDVRYVKGPVEQTLLDPANLPERIALLRLDTDWYASTKMELEILYPRLSAGGILIIDDYGHWKGAQKAVDEYFALYDPHVFLHRIDYTGRLVIKG